MSKNHLILKASGENNCHLHVEGLSIDFSHEGKLIRAVNNISFSVNRGRCLGIVGESGSGKSVTSLAVMRLLPDPVASVDQGRIEFHTQDGSMINLPGLSEKEMRTYRGKRISMIFQEPMTSLNPSYRCGKQVMENILQHDRLSKKDAREKTLQLFREVQLNKPEVIFRSYPHQLSGGQKQRVMIAMAIACNPEILIADEPTTALDVTVQKAILQLLRSLQRKYNMSLIFISHDLSVIAEIADDVIVMYKGEIVEKGSVSDLFRNPEHPYTRGLLACRPSLTRRPERLPVIPDFFGEKPFEYRDVKPAERKENHVRLYSGKPLLVAEDITLQYVSKRSLLGRPLEVVNAVDRVSFEVFAGETLGLVGESGCGKTSLGRTLLRLTEPDSGKIVYNDKEICKLPANEMRLMRKKMQIIFQDPYSSLNPRLTVGYSITEPMKMYRLNGSSHQRKLKAIELLNKVGLDEGHFFRYPHELSGGQRQRVCIARALALEPEFIICDESVSALDVSIQAQVLNLLNELKREYGFTYIFISHDLSVVKFMSDRMMVMQNGKIVEIGEADQLYTSPGTEYTRNLIDAIPMGIQ